MLLQKNILIVVGATYGAIILSNLLTVFNDTMFTVSLKNNDIFI